MPKITYADEVDAHFGIPWTDDLKYDKGELACALSEDEIDALPQERAEILSRLMIDQPNSEKEDPIKWGWTLPGWRRVMDRWDKDKIHVILGGNRSSKSTLCSRFLVHLAQQIPEAEIRSMHVSEERSIADAQRYIWEALPARYKRAKKKSTNHSLQYTQKNGFNSGKAILPPNTSGAERGSTISFNNYRQYMADPQIFEGWSAHAIHCDEEVSEAIFNTLLARLTDFSGRLLLSFTTLQGYTPLINSLLKGAKTVTKKYSKLLGRELPIEQVSANWPDCRIYYFWSEMSPFVNANELIRTYSQQPLEVKLARLYGIPSKAVEGRFPKFNRETNVVPHEKIPFIQDDTRAVTRYMVVDPGGSKPWVCIWAGVMRDGSIYVYREESNIITTMANLGFVMRPAPGVEIETGIAKINDALSWNDTEPMTDENKPKLYISDRCENTITSMMEYTGQSRSEHFKDQLDCIRYLMVSGADHITNQSMMATGGGGY
jgi:hypothetical protein